MDLWDSRGERDVIRERKSERKRSRVNYRDETKKTG